MNPTRRFLGWGAAAGALAVGASQGAQALSMGQDLVLLAAYPGRSLGPLFPAQSATEGAIRAAFNQAVAAGGGVVLIPSGVISISAALPMAQGVSYEGSGCGASMYGSSTVPNINGGTIIDGGGGNFNGFEYNPVDRGSPYSTEAQLLASSITGCRIENLTVRNVAYGFKFGALYQGGIDCLYLDNVGTYNCSQWGFWIENCHTFIIGRITAYNSAAGGVMMTCSGGSLWNYGNSQAGHIVVQNTGNLYTSRGVCLMARNSSQHNDVLINHITSVGPVCTATIIPVLTAGNNNIPVPDLTKFAVDIPIIFNQSNADFTINNVYWVQSVSGNSGAGTITICKYPGGPVKAITQTVSSISFTVRAGAAVEMRTDGSANSGITQSKIFQTDTEACGVVDVAMTFCTNCWIWLGTISATTPGATLYANSNTWNSGVTCNAQAPYYDMDSGGNFTVNGFTPAVFTRAGVGFRYSLARFTWALSVDAYGEALIAPDTTNTIRNIGTTRTISEAVQYVASGGNIGSGGSAVVYTGAAAGNLNLPNVTGSLHIGVRYAISNPTSGTVTLNTQGSLNINNIAATTSFTLPANSVTYATLMQTTSVSGVYYWAVK